MSNSNSPPPPAAAKLDTAALIAESRLAQFFCFKCGHHFTRQPSDVTENNLKNGLHDDQNGCGYIAMQLPPNPLVVRLVDALERAHRETAAALGLPEDADPARVVARLKQWQEALEFYAHAKYEPFYRWATSEVAEDNGSRALSALSPVPPPAPPVSEAEDRYLLQNVGAGYLGNSPVFWNDRGGYTQWIDDAKKFTDAACEKIINSTRGSHEWRKWPWSQINAAAQRTVDSQKLTTPAAPEANRD